MHEDAAAELNVPSLHVWHFSVPSEPLYLPAGHSTQAWEFTEYPLPHAQSSELSLPVGDVAPEGHAEHTVAAGTLLYLPSAHDSQYADPMSLAYFPASQAVHGEPSSPK